MPKAGIELSQQSGRSRYHWEYLPSAACHMEKWLPLPPRKNKALVVQAYVPASRPPECSVAR